MYVVLDFARSVHVPNQKSCCASRSAATVAVAMVTSTDTRH